MSLASVTTGTLRDLCDTDYKGWCRPSPVCCAFYGFPIMLRLLSKRIVDVDTRSVLSRLLLALSVLLSTHCHSCLANPTRPDESPSLASKGNSSDPLPPGVSCNGRRSWVGSGYVLSHCHAAVHRLLDEEIRRWGETNFEFLAPDVHPIFAVRTRRTPLKYVVGKASFSPLPLSAGLPPNPGLIWP